MKWYANSKSQRCEIEHDPFVGFYLYVFENEKCTHDYLQDTLEAAIEQAWKDFGIFKSAWKKAED